MKRYDKHRVTEKAVIRGPILLTVILACVAFIDPSRADASEPVAFSALEDILTAENHPRLYDTEEAAHAFYAYKNKRAHQRRLCTGNKDKS